MSKKAKSVPTPPPVAAKGKFDPKNYAKGTVSEEEVIEIKAAFDLFDSDQGGSVDINGNDLIIKN